MIRRVGRYELHDLLASGGMGSVHLGMLRGDHGFSRVVAIKRMHPHLALDPGFAAMFLDEARLAERIRHPNVVTTLDVVADGPELFLVMDLVVGQSLSRVLTGATAVPSRIVTTLVRDVLRGLQAVHTATDADGRALGLVHRDVSPHNILVAQEGSARLLDFGVAKATQAAALTHSGAIRGKLAYIAPEQLRGEPLDARGDLFSLGVTAWEALTARRLFRADDDPSTIARVLSMNVPPPSAYVEGVDPLLEQVIMRALDRDPGRRFASAPAMAERLEPAPRADEGEVSRWLAEVAAESLRDLRLKVQAAERAAPEGPAASSPALSVPPPPLPPPPRPASRARGVLLTLAAFLVGGGIVFAARAGVGPRAPALNAAPSLRSPTADDVSASPLPAAAALPDAAPSAPSTSSVPSAPVDAGAPTSPRPPAAHGSTRSPAAGPAHPGSSTCTPPYDLDAEGIKHWKRECLPP